MRLPDFEALVERLLAEMPPEYLDGILGVEVSRDTLPHPVRGEVYTLGECIPLPGEGDAQIRSRVVLYHGSFRALGEQNPDFEWRAEAWETLTHEIRHHLEWRARAPDLEAFDRAAEANFARHTGEEFDPLFYQAGETVADGVYRIDDDYFLERTIEEIPARLEFDWHGRGYAFTMPPDLAIPAMVTVTGIAHPPPGDVEIVLRRPTRLPDICKRPELPRLVSVEATPASAAGAD
jgi:hypothetical protein